MEFIKLYLIIGVITGSTFEFLYWFIKKELVTNDHRYFKKYGGFIIVFIWPYNVYGIINKIH